MIARPNAPFYETALIQAIAERNGEAAVHQIEGIQKYRGNHEPSLTVVDENGVNFLAIALGTEYGESGACLIEYTCI